MESGNQSEQITLDQACAVGRAVLDDYEPFTILPEQRRTDPICESYAGDVITETIVRGVTIRVLEQLAALPEGTWMEPPQRATIGGVKQEAIYKGNVALSFRLQFDGSKLQTVLHVGGYIVADDRKVMAGLG